MSRTHQSWLLALVAVATLSFSGAALAGDIYDKDAPKPDAVALPKPADIQTLEIYPTKIALKGSDDAQQFVLTAKLAGDKLQDLSMDATYEVANPKIVRVTSSGRVIPLSNGATEVVAKFGDKSVKVPVTTDQVDIDLPINFGNQIVPIFTKLGCNSGGCHGKASGQGGFKLSLLGFDPEFDYSALVKEARGRRLFPVAPEHSLLLLKATGTMAHGGGKRTEVGSDEYKLMRRWIGAGTPFGKPEDPVVTKITVYPEHRVMTRHGKQQFAVYAHYSDNSIEDVTRRAQYDSNDTEVAIVDGTALVRTLTMTGESAIMARYQGQVAVFRSTVPSDIKTPAYQFPYLTAVDKHTHNKWQQLNLVPSELCNDEQFIRRASVDITGTMPTPKAVNDFVNDKDPQKRDKLVDRLIDTQEYSYYFANKWADILHVKRRQQQGNAAQGTFAFHAWIREAMASDMPYDEFAREILTATGDESKHAPTVWYKELQQPNQFVDDTAQVFLGLRLACAQCHHHPYEKWGQDDYWGIAAFFGRIGRKNIAVPGYQGQNGQGRTLLAVYNLGQGNVTNKRTNQPAIMKPLDGAPMIVER
ncbi:S-layer protein, partial [Planctomycetaceae bacterium SCGC AG-212-D15]